MEASSNTQHMNLLTSQIQDGGKSRDKSTDLLGMFASILIAGIHERSEGLNRAKEREIIS